LLTSRENWICPSEVHGIVRGTEALENSRELLKVAMYLVMWLVNHHSTSFSVSHQHLLVPMTLVDLACSGISECVQEIDCFSEISFKYAPTFYPPVTYNYWFLVLSTCCLV
jgi:hypothetical protein